MFEKQQGNVESIHKNFWMQPQRARTSEVGSRRPKQNVRVSLGTCYDSVIASQVNQPIPKNQSYFTDGDYLDKTQQTEEEIKAKNKRLLERTETDIKIIRTNQLQDKLNEQITQKDKEEKLKERQKIFAIVQEDSEKNAPDFIKKANVFQSQNARENITALEEKARLVQEKIAREKAAAEKIKQ